MKKTLADLLNEPRNYSGPTQENVRMSMEKMPESNKERVFTVSIILEAHEVEILDNKVVIEKRVVAYNRREALDKCGFTVKE